MIPRYAMPSIITRSPARRAHPRTRLGDVTRSPHENAFPEHWLEGLSDLGTWRAFGELTRAHRGGPGLHRGLSCSRERSWLRKACALEQHEADYYVVRITLFSSRICRPRNLTSCGHLRCVYGNLSREIWSRIGSEVNSGDLSDRNLEV